MLSGVQITWSGMNSRKLEISEEGTCRICGGPLLGEIMTSKEFYSDNWVDEAFIKNPKSFLVCQPCNLSKKLYSKGLGGYIATQNSFKNIKTHEDVLMVLENLPDEPYVLVFKTFQGLMRKHLVYFTTVNYSKQYASALFVFGHWAGAGKQIGTISGFNFSPLKTLHMVNELKKSNPDTPVLSPATYGPEAHLASYIVFKEKVNQKIN
ncbi:MAG TPA: hypothetical protein PK728_07110 [Bacillota bacterium]|nr:hypothetical protein [Bacillota bacterium]